LAQTVWPGIRVWPVRWVWRYIGTSLLLGAKDGWQTMGQRAVISVLAVVVTGGLVYLATGKATTALLGIAAWPIMLVGAWLVYSVDRLFGRERLWSWNPQVSPDKTRINVNLNAKGGLLWLMMRNGSEITNVVWDPEGRATRVEDIRSFSGRDLLFFTYPELGAPAGQLAPGVYWISWQWRKPNKSKWHVYAAHRVVVGS
jgi:hypothetical protein